MVRNKKLATSALADYIGISLDPEGRKMVLGQTGLPALFCPALLLPATIFPPLSRYVAANKNLQISKKVKNAHNL